MRLTRSKYGAQPQTVDNIRFDSKAEALRYCELKLLMAAGEIRSLDLQPEFELYACHHTGGDVVKLGIYRADFRYREGPTGLLRIEDVKGFDVPLGRWKRKHAEAQYGVVITLVK